jgi:FkbM family methyltransferase
VKRLVKINIPLNKKILIPYEIKGVFHDFEKLSVKYFIKYLRHGDCFIDIGASFGFYSVLGSNLVGKKGKVIAFEPSLQSLKILKQNTSKLKNIKIVEKASSNRTKKIAFYNTIDLVNSGTVKNPPFQKKQSVIKTNVDAVKLDDYLKNLKEINFLKIDVQGDDIKTLLGAKKIIKRSKNIKILVEWAPAWMKSAGYTALDLPKALIRLGFKKLIVLDDWQNKKMEVKDFLKIIKKGTQNKRHVNLFALY